MKSNWLDTYTNQTYYTFSYLETLSILYYQTVAAVETSLLKLLKLYIHVNVMSPILSENLNQPIGQNLLSRLYFDIKCNSYWIKFKKTFEKSKRIIVLFLNLQYIFCFHNIPWDCVDNVVRKVCVKYKNKPIDYEWVITCITLWKNRNIIQIHLNNKNTGEKETFSKAFRGLSSFWRLGPNWEI